MQPTETLSGTIEKFIYQNEENGYSIFLLQVRANAPITVAGYAPGIQPGQEVQIIGSWTFHPKFGKQFTAQQCTAKLPTTLTGLKKYLGSGAIKGIGKTYADKIVDYFGTNALKIIEEHPDRLSEVAGIGPKRIEQIKEAWFSQKDIADIMVFLQDKNITPGLAAKIYKKYKQESIAVLKENPYRLADEVWGVGFKMADEIAQKLDFALHAPQRISAGILYVISLATQQGHLYIELQDLRNKTIELLGLDADDHAHLLKQSLHTLYDKEKIKLLTEDGVHYLTLSQYFAAEKGIASRLKTLIEKESPHSFDIERIYQSLRVGNEHEIQLNEDQQQGIISALQHKVTIITGGPGTGKTTLIKKLLGILDQSRVNYKLAAPTGRAAKRIIEGTGKFAATIHRLLEFDVATMGFTHNEHNALKLDFLIIDEASMIDVFLANAIVKALPHNAHLILIGDIDQLPSVGAGNVLNDLIESQKVACVKLSQIFRQAQDSLIVVNAHKVNSGEFPVSYLPDARNDFMLIKDEEPENITQQLKKLLFVELPKKGISPENAMILTPMNRGLVGTYNLNHILQELLNPQKTPQSITYSGTSFKKGDKVMQIRNNYDKNVYNGDVGTIDTVDIDDKELLVDYGDHKLIPYDFEELNELVLAYAISIHKSQGSEYPAVIIPLFMQHFMLLQRNLVYTAITRAKKLCILVGQPKAMIMAIKNNKNTKRITFLQKFLTEAA